MAMLTRAERDAKARRTDQTANEIIGKERAASEAKTARLKALREGRPMPAVEPEAQE